MKASSVKSLVLCSLLASNLSSCLSYDRSSSDDDFASDNVIAVDNSVTQGSDSNASDKSPCECLDVWKPISESDGNLALIFDEAFPVPFTSVQVNRVIEEAATVAKVEPEFGEFAGFEGVSGRQVWRFNHEGAAYDGSFLVEYDSDVCEGMVDEPGERHDLSSDNSGN